jgi:hypothetical protein
MYLEEAVKHVSGAVVVATHTLSLRSHFVHCLTHFCCKALSPPHPSLQDTSLRHLKTLTTEAMEKQEDANCGII